jgi:16S rRNA (cytidine1402-2'-O)-methyltransferase
MKRQKTNLNESAKLYLVGTPIGNFDDMTFRAVNTLKMVDVVFCEDTRVTGQLLKYLDISKKLISSHEYNEEKNKQKLLEYLESGSNVGLVSDRGTPIISDPGYELAKFAIEEGYNVVSLPGATALIPALTSSGISPMPFYYYGFLNSKDSARRKELEFLKNIDATLILYEAPHRINKTLKDMQNILGNNRKISISREITKKYEEIYRGSIEELVNQNNEYKGELVIVVEGNKTSTEYKSLTIEEHINLYIEDGKSSMDAIKIVAKERGMKKSEVYDIYHNIEKGK